MTVSKKSLKVAALAFVNDNNSQAKKLHSVQNRATEQSLTSHSTQVILGTSLSKQSPALVLTTKRQPNNTKNN